MSGPVCVHPVEQLRAGRRCGIDSYGFYLGSSGPTRVIPAASISGLPSPDATPLQQSAPPSANGSPTTPDEIELGSVVNPPPRELELRRRLELMEREADVAWWIDTNDEVVVEVRDRATAARTGSPPSGGDGAMSPSSRSGASPGGIPGSNLSLSSGGTGSIVASTVAAVMSDECRGGSKHGPWAREALLRARRRIRRGGLRMEERRVAWPLLTGASVRPMSPNVFEQFLRDPMALEHEEVMLRDLGRTMPLHVLFKDESSPGQRSLRRVLHAYCARDPEVGYCQGMGFLVSVLLLHMDEPTAFGVLWQLMHGRQYLMRQLYQQGFPLLQKMLSILQALMGRFLPNLHAHFAAQGIEPAFYASHWFLTLFAYQFPVPLVCRIWDLFISEGWKIVFKVAIALLQWEEKKLVRMSMEKVLLLLKTIHEKKDPEVIISRAMALPIKERDLRISGGTG